MSGEMSAAQAIRLRCLEVITKMPAQHSMSPTAVIAAAAELERYVLAGARDPASPVLVVADSTIAGSGGAAGMRPGAVRYED